MMSWFLRLALVSLALCWLAGCAQKSAPTYLSNSVPQRTPTSQTAPGGYDPISNYNANQNIAGSRLDKQPWPPGMGQTISTSNMGGAAIGGATASAAGTVPPAPGLSSAPPIPTSSASSKTKVAILLPLTGHNAALGQAMLNAAQQAVFDVSGQNFELMPRDTGDTEAGADTAARDALASGAKLLIGPLFAAQIPAVRAVAQPAGVNILTLSTDISMAGPGVYVMGFAPTPQVDRVVGYALGHGAKRFAALVPDNAYGQLVGQEFQTAVSRGGGTVVAYQTYSPSLHDLDTQFRTLLSFRSQVDGFFLPEGGADLNRINNLLVASGMDGHTVRLVGTGLWDVDDLGATNAAINGGIYAASDSASRQNFVNSYSATYGHEPPRLATLAYDATALAAVLARRNSAFDQAALTNPNGFAGVDGIFRLTPQGLVERGLAVNEVTNHGAHVLELAPASFLNAR